MTKRDIDIESIINYQKVEYQHIFDRLKNRQFNTPYNLKDGMLYFQEDKGEKKNKLVLPSVILSNILYNLHTKNDSHILGVEMEKYIKSNYKIKNFKHIEKQIRKQCIGCCISQSALNQKTRTLQRSYSYKVQPGEHFFIDAFYLNYNNKEYYVLLLVDLATGYISVRLLKDLSQKCANRFFWSISSKSNIEQ